jgi:phenylacetate-CoA ligase
MDADRVGRVIGAYTSFFEGTPDQESVLDLFHRVAATVPAYRKFLAEHHVKPADIATMEDFHRLPVMDKENYHRRYPLPERCRGGSSPAGQTWRVSYSATRGCRR